MMDAIEPEGDPVLRTRDTARIQAALRLATQDALRLHKAIGNPIVVWRDGKVVWIPPEEIPVDLDPVSSASREGEVAG